LGDDLPRPGDQALEGGSTDVEGGDELHPASLPARRVSAERGATLLSVVRPGAVFWCQNIVGTT
ncbi:MAG: hypothetical protein ABIV05_00715, partial [Actinomycetota bacterium]